MTEPAVLVVGAVFAPEVDAHRLHLRADPVAIRHLCGTVPSIVADDIGIT